MMTKLIAISAYSRPVSAPVARWLSRLPMVRRRKAELGRDDLSCFAATLDIGHDDRRVDHAGAAVLVTHRHLRGEFAAPRVDRLDEARVLLLEMAATQLARARELVLVGIELLGQV